IAAVVNELAPLAGGRIQRVDVVDAREVVFEIRCVGRTLRLLVSARSGLGRIHLVERRPPKVVPGGGLQATLRSRFEGRPIAALDTPEERVVRIAVPD